MQKTSPFRTRSARPLLCAALAAIALLMAERASGQTGNSGAGAEIVQPSMMQFPLPAAPLGEPDIAPSPDILAIPATTGTIDATVFDPSLVAIADRTTRSNAHGQARTPIPVDIIRNGFSARSGINGPSPEQSVGFKLGADIFSVSTKLVAPPGYGQGQDARIDWRLAHPIADAGPGFIWTIATGGGGGIAGNREQNGEVLIGYRHRLFEHLTFTSQIAMNNNYVFASGGGLHSAVMPEIKLSANLAALADLPWEASADIALGRKMPLVASDFETRGTAMLRFKYTLQ